MSNHHQVTRDFEAALCEYTGAKYAVAVNSCTMALLLACAWFLRKDAPMTATIVRMLGLPGKAPRIEIPRETYVSVPQAIIHAGGRPVYRDEDWLGMYRLSPLPVFDSARWFTEGLYYIAEQHSSFRPKDGAGSPMVCVSFHASKTLGDSQGGAILHSSDEADEWLRRARFDGRTEGVAPKNDVFSEIGYHCYMSPDVAARLLWKLSVLPRNNDPLPNDDYPDLSKIEAFQ